MSAASALRRVGVEADYAASGAGQTHIAGYPGPLPPSQAVERAMRATLSPLLARVRPTMSEGQALRAVLGADRLLIAWRANGPVGLLTARRTASEGLSVWYLTVGAVDPAHTGVGLFKRLINALVGEEPCAMLCGTTKEVPVYRAFRSVAAGRVLQPIPGRDCDPRVVRFGRDVIARVLGPEAARGVDERLVRRSCYPFVADDREDRRTPLVPGLGPSDGVVAIADLTGAFTARIRPSAVRTGVDGQTRARQRIGTVAVTGTNGKTGLVEFGRQLGHAASIRSASFGSLGVITELGRHRTPTIGKGPLALPRLAQRLWGAGWDLLWCEAFSYALGRGLLDRLPVDVGVLTHVDVDHLGSHGTLAAYRAAKERLFETAVVPGGTVVADPSAEGARRVLDIARRRDLRVVTVGPGQDIELRADSLRVHDVVHPLRLSFGEDAIQATAALAAAAAIAAGVDSQSVARALPDLRTPPGRFHRLSLPGRATVVVDSAHNADALEVLLTQLRRETHGRLLVLVASVGSAEATRWEPIGEVADVLADVVVVADESPYRQDAAVIRSGIKRGCPRAIEIPDREDAVAWLLHESRPGDTVALTGRADEDFIVGPNGKTRAPTDAQLARRAIEVTVGDARLPTLRSGRSRTDS